MINFQDYFGLLASTEVEFNLARTSVAVAKSSDEDLDNIFTANVRKMIAWAASHDLELPHPFEQMALEQEHGFSAIDSKTRAIIRKRLTSINDRLNQHEYIVVFSLFESFIEYL